MKNLCLFLIIIFQLSNASGQVYDSIPPIDDFIESDYKGQIELIKFDTNKRKISSNIELISIDVVSCDRIKDESILPSKFHRQHLIPRLVELKTDNKIMKITFVFRSSCCSKFFSKIKLESDSVINLIIEDRSEIECFCMGCPYFFTYLFRVNNDEIRNIKVNGVFLNFSDDIYENQTTITEKNKFSKKKITRIYSGEIHINNLMLELFYDRKGKLIKKFTYYHGVKTNEKGSAEKR